MTIEQAADVLANVQAFAAELADRGLPIAVDVVIEVRVNVGDVEAWRGPAS